MKANAYGHGLLTVAHILQSVVDGFGVACLEEALLLRQQGIKNRIVLLEGFFEASELAFICDHTLEIVLHHQAQLDILETVTLKNPLTVWLKINTGMNRLGFPCDHVSLIHERLTQCASVAPAIVLMTHFSMSESINEPTTLQQIERFNLVTRSLSGERSLSNSGGLLLWPQSNNDWVRPGIALYGISPIANQSGINHGLKPVMTFKSRLIAIQSLKSGDRIGYGGTYVCPEAMQVGLIPVGYGDGYPYSAPSGTPVLLNGQQVPLVGRVSMDRLTVDLRSQPDAMIGDDVILWGDGLPVETIAQHSNTIPYVLVCGMHKRS